MLTTETLAGLRATDHHRLLCHTARHLLWDWRGAAKIMAEVWAIAERNAHRYDPTPGPPSAFVCCIRDRLTYEYMDANGLFPPEECAELAARINNELPPSLREACHTWLADRPIDAVTGVRVRVGLKLLGRSAA